MVGREVAACNRPCGAGTLHRMAAVVGVALLLGVHPQVVQARKKDPAREARIAIIRALGQEVAVCKIELPRGKHGIVVDSQGQVDQAKAREQMRRHGLAIKPGSPVQITRIRFKSNRVKLDLNGGGKKNKKWYERIQIGGMGGTTTPITSEGSTMAYGSSITLEFPGKLETMTPELVKKLLVHVLDFQRQSPTVLYSQDVPPEVKEAIKNHQVLVGMDRDAVLSSKGPPDRKVRETRAGVEQEDWIYGLPPRVLFVTFDGDRVVQVKQF